MFKTILSVLTALAILIACSTHADAQYVPYGNVCCDSYGNGRCIINTSPLWTECYCYGQGYGTVCR